MTKHPVVREVSLDLLMFATEIDSSWTYLGIRLIAIVIMVTYSTYLYSSQHLYQTILWWNQAVLMMKVKVKTTLMYSFPQYLIYVGLS